MTETLSTHHKIKAEWTKASKNEIYDESSSDSEKLEIVEDENCESRENLEPAPKEKIEILEQIVIYSGKSVKCHFCDHNFDKAIIDEHQKIHEKTFFHCMQCDKQFRRKSSLRRHSYLHLGKYKYECIECKVTFIDLSKYEIHKNTKHPTKDSIRYECQEINCGKTFASPEYLKRHQVTHRGKKYFNMLNSFNIFNNLDEFKYKCTVCDQKFKWMTSLQLHQTIHTQNKTLVECKQCRKRFFNQRTMERHQRIHKNLKYKCTICEKVVSNRKDNILRHLRHLHADVQKSELSSKIATVEDGSTNDLDADPDADDEVEDSSSSNDVVIEMLEVVESPKAPTPPPLINNRVKVIQSIGNPLKHQQKEVYETPETLINPSPPPRPQETETEIILPPKKKATTVSQPSTSSNTSAKPKYDPIQHYRKILLGFSKDDDPPTDSVEEDESGQEPQVFPIHWRKRTSQNFMFRR